MSDSHDSKPIDRWMPWLFVLFFLVVFAANGIMVYVGATTWTGLETKQHYVKGLAYNETLDEVERQKALGWTGDLSVGPGSQGQVKLDFVLHDKQDRAVPGATVTAKLVRPTSEGHDLDIRMDDYGRGRYVGVADLDLRGQWDVRVVAKHPSGDFRLTRRIVVP
jgi:nitrogen fixation protein FixH